MPGPVETPSIVAHERRNVFLEADAACAESKRSDARRHGDVTWPAADLAGSPIEAEAQDASRSGSRLAHRRRRQHPSSSVVRRSAAALAVAVVTAALLSVALALPDQQRMRADHSGRPATAAPVVNEPRDIPRRPGSDEAPRSRHTTRARPRPRPTRAAARSGVRRPAPTRAPPSPPSLPAVPAPSRSLAPSPSPTQSPALSPTPSAAPAPSRVIPREAALPAPVPSDAPPEFM